ncbi:MAG: OmpH family outer membrane protein [Parachlamydiaceae bacterium]|nr:OmpH family outer membrane protein [Parachlamydiaceae bacterium]
MKNRRYLLIGLGCLLSSFISQQGFSQQSSSLETQQFSQTSAVPSASAAFRVGVVNAKKCLEESKMGKQEQANFEKMKSQMESVLLDKEKTLEDIESKLNDDDFMDGISDEAASELRRKKRNLRNEGMQLQNQYMQTLQQANVKVIEKLQNLVSKASEVVAKKQHLDGIFTDEALTYYNKERFDVSNAVIDEMNAIFEAEFKDAPKGRL